MKTAPAVAATVAASLLYATLRYNVFGVVPWGSWPAFIVNKGICLSLCLFLLYSAFCTQRGKPEQASSWAQAAVCSTAVHIMLSLGLFTPQFFDTKFFVDAMMTVSGQILLLAGTLTVCTFYQVSRGRTDKRRRQLNLLAMLLLIIHLAAVGCPTWITPSAWPGHMPPISLLSAILVALTIGVQWRSAAQPVGDQR